MNLRNRPAAGDKVLLAKGPAYNSINFNLSHPPLDDIRVRQALSYAMDEKRVLDTLTRGTAVLATADLPDFYWAYDPNVKKYAHDPQKANALLDAAGWNAARTGCERRTESRFRFNSCPVREIRQRDNSGLRSNRIFAQVGVDVPIKTYTYTVLYATKAVGGILNSGKFDLAEYLDLRRGSGQLVVAGCATWFPRPATTSPTIATSSSIARSRTPSRISTVLAVFGTMRSRKVFSPGKRRQPSILPAKTVCHECESAEFHAEWYQRRLERL